ncbi:hypothetical protein D9B85_15430, partial [Corynebacterium diphtheriae]
HPARAPGRARRAPLQSGARRGHLRDVGPHPRPLVTAAAEITQLELPAELAELLSSQELAEGTFVMWDLIHDR